MRDVHRKIDLTTRNPFVIAMDQRKRNTYQRQLLNRREDLISLVRTAETYRRDRDLESTHDPLDLAANAYSKELIVSMSSNDRQLLKSIDTALEFIKVGKYGDCAHCGEPIQEKRLEAVPWALHCLFCQDLSERSLL